MPIVSIIVNCLNGEKYLREALESVVAQSFEDWEVIFFDNCSSDRSSEIASSFGPKVRIFRSNVTGPLGWARARAFEHAKGDFLAILDADDIWLPNKLEEMVPLFRSPEVGLIFSDSQYFDEFGDREKCFSKERVPEKGDIFRALLVQNFISSETMMFRKSHLQKLKQFFNEGLTVACDYDLTLRLALITKSDYCPKVLSKWRIHSQSVTSKRPFLAAREMLQVIACLEVEMKDEIGKYRVEIEKLRTDSNYQIARELFLSGERLQSVCKILPLCFQRPKWLLIFMTYLLMPIRLFRYIQQRRQMS